MATETLYQAEYGLSLDDADTLSEKALKLKALLVHTYGNSGEAFRAMNDDSQDSYLWTCSNLMDEIAELTTELNKTRVTAPVSKMAAAA